MNAGAFGNPEKRRARALEIIAEQKAASERYRAENPTRSDVSADVVTASLAAQRQRDELDAAREALKPDFETAFKLAAKRRKTAQDAAPKPRITLPAARPHVTAIPFGPPAPLPAHTIASGDGEITPETAKVLKREEKKCRREMEKAEAAAIQIQIFIGPRTPTDALMADALHAAHVKTVKACLAALKDVQPVISRYKATLKAAQVEGAIETFLEESETDTGMSQSREEYSKSTNKKTRLKEMAREICARLRSVGIEATRDDGCGLWTYWIHSGVWEEIDQYRRICINPVVAALSRAKILASLEFFIQEHRFCRFWTFTTGTRCTVSEIGERLDKFSRKLSKLNYWMRKNYGVEIVIASTEFGTLEDMDSHPDDEGQIKFVRILNPETGMHEDQPTYHPHFHCVVRVIGKSPLSLERWTELCERVRARWGFQCDFDGVINSAREIVKYVTKPGDLLKLTPLQLRAFYEATSNRRLVRPMGALRREIAERNDPSDLSAKKTLKRIRVGRAKWKWVERFDHNQTLSDTHSPEERAEHDELVDCQVYAQELEAAANACGGVIELGETLTLWNDGSSVREGTQRVIAEGHEIRLKDKPAFCQVVAYIAPAAGPSMRKENRVIVMGNRRDQDAVNRHPLVIQMRERTLTAWRAGEALAASEEASASGSGIYLDTGTVTVPDELQTPDGWRLDDPIQLVFPTA